jgi:hypothetical protein
MSELAGGAVPLEQGRFDQTLEALSEVDACRVIDHQVVQAWAESLSSETPMLLRQQGCLSVPAGAGGLARAKSRPG